MFGLTTILWCIYPRAMGSFILKQVNLKSIFYFNTQSYLHISYLCSKGGQNSMVSTVTCYRLDVLGFKCWWGQDFLDPPSLLYKGYQVSFLKMKWQGCGADHPPLLVLSSCIQTVHTHTLQGTGYSTSLFLCSWSSSPLSTFRCCRLLSRYKPSEP
jgi:hypothetical protein